MITEKDKQLLGILKTNARMPVSELARRLKVSRTTVQQRLARLEQNGHITGYKVQLSDSLTRSTIKAYVNLAVDPNASRQIVAALEKLPAIETLLTVSGKVDLIAIVSVGSAAELDEQLDRISEISGIRSTETSIVLGTKFDRS